MFNARRAFTLVELLVVVAILGMLAAIASVSASNSREKARISSAQSLEAATGRGLGDVELARWKFEEGSGATLYDASSNGNNVILSGIIDTDWVAGVRGGALNFRGAAYGSVPGIPMTSFSAGLTLSFWIKTTRYSANWMWPVATSVYAGWFQCGKVSGNGNVRFDSATSGNGTNSTNTVGVNIADGNWHHVACSYDPSTTQKRIYVDGAVRASGTAPVPVWSALGNLQIGSHPGPAEYWNGQIDELAVYGRALTAQNVEGLYAEGLGALYFAAAP